MRAAALTYFTLLSIIPILALLLSMAQFLNIEQFFEQLFSQYWQGQEELAQKALHYSQNLIQGVKSGKVAGFGLLILFWSIIRIMSNIEIIMNDIWEVSEARKFHKRYRNYFFGIILFSLSLILVGLAIVFVFSALRFNNKLFLIALRLISLILLLTTLTLLYKFTPNTKTFYISALWGSVFATLAYVILQFIYFHLQAWTNQKSVVFGSIAALPLFMMWINLSWWVILFGAVVSRDHQVLTRANQG